MAVEDDDDRAALLADFGQEATLTLANPPTTVTVITGIFDNKFIEAAAFLTEEGVDSKQPMINCRTSDVSIYGRDDLLTTGGVDYTIQTVDADGTGFTNLILQVV